MSKEKCPFCGSKKVSQTGKGVAESVVKGVGAFGVGLLVSAFNRGAGQAAALNISHNITSEYKCEACGRLFRYSENGGSQRK